MADAAEFTERILAEADEAQRLAYRRYFPERWEEFAGVRMGTVFQLAKGYLDLPVRELDTMLEHPVHEVRVGALKAMALAASARRVTEERRRELVELYLRRHDRIDDWDLVDLAAIHVVGAWARDADATLLDRLAASDSPWERRTAIVATAACIRAGDLDTAERIATTLAGDAADTVQKGVGWMLRMLGDADRDRLLAFLDRHPELPRVALRAAIEKLPPEERKVRLARR